MNIVFLILGGVLGFVLGRKTKKSLAPASPEKLKELQHIAQEAVSRRTEDRKEEILELMRRAVERHEELKACSLVEERKGINRRDVEELLEVSDQTALKYINELEAEGKIQQVGVSGRDVYYMLVA